MVATELYSFMAHHKAKDKKAKEIFMEISRMESGHAEIWNAVAEHLGGKKFRGGLSLSLKKLRVKLLSLIMPLTFMMYYLELDERSAIIEYSRILRYFKDYPEFYSKIVGVIKDEIGHELRMFDMLLGTGTRVGRIKEAIYGMTDSLVEILALVIGLAGVIREPLLVGLAGFISAIGGTFSMTSGSFLAARSERDLYLGRIRELKIREELGGEFLLADLKDALIEKGVPEKEATKIVSSMGEFSPTILRNLLQSLTTEEPPAPGQVAKTTGTYYILGALPAILPFFIAAILGLSSTVAVIFALFAAAIVSFVAGIFTAVLSGISIKKKSIGNVVIIIGAAMATYLIATLARMFLGIEV